MDNSMRDGARGHRIEDGIQALCLEDGIHGLCMKDEVHSRCMNEGTHVIAHGTARDVPSTTSHGMFPPRHCMGVKLHLEFAEDRAVWSLEDHE